MAETEEAIVPVLVPEITELTTEKEKIEAENPGNKVNGKPEVEKKPELEEKPEEKKIKSPEEDEREKENCREF